MEVARKKSAYNTAVPNTVNSMLPACPHPVLNLIAQNYSIHLFYIMDFLALVTLTAQLLPIMNDSYGGVSGQDSIWRAVLAQMDQSRGGLYLIGLFSIAIPSSSIRAHRIGLLHTPGQASVDSIEVAVRPKWMNLASQHMVSSQL